MVLIGAEKPRSPNLTIIAQIISQPRQQQNIKLTVKGYSNY